MSAARGPAASPRASSPFALRLARPSWRDRRLLLGLVLVLGSTLIGARALGTADTGAPVWVARHELAPGVPLRGSDLEVRAVRVDSSAPRYVSASVPLADGIVLTRVIGAGELIPVGAVDGAADAGADRRVVTIPVEAFHAAPDLTRGDRVDVYVTPSRGSDGAGGSVGSVRLVGSADVVAVEDSAGRFGGSGAARGVDVSVASAAVPALVAGMARGTVDLVRVPRTGP